MASDGEMDSCLLCDRPLTWGDSVAGIEISIILTDGGGQETARYLVGVCGDCARSHGRSWLDRRKRRDAVEADEPRHAR